MDHQRMGMRELKQEKRRENNNVYLVPNKCPSSNGPQVYKFKLHLFTSITNFPPPVHAYDATTKKYVDSSLATAATNVNTTLSSLSSSFAGLTDVSAVLADHTDKFVKVNSAGDNIIFGSPQFNDDYTPQEISAMILSNFSLGHVIA